MEPPLRLIIWQVGESRVVKPVQALEILLQSDRLYVNGPLYLHLISLNISSSYYELVSLSDTPFVLHTH